jgi:hypothetical protein
MYVANPKTVKRIAFVMNYITDAVFVNLDATVSVMNYMNLGKIVSLTKKEKIVE